MQASCALIVSALAGLVAAGSLAAAPAMAADKENASASPPPAKRLRQRPGTHSCAGQATKDKDPVTGNLSPRGSCEKWAAR